MSAVKMAYDEFVIERHADKSTITVPSEKSFRNAFNECVRDLKIKIKTRKTVSKSDVCVRLREKVARLNPHANVHHLPRSMSLASPKTKMTPCSNEYFNTRSLFEAFVELTTHVGRWRVINPTLSHR